MRLYALAFIVLCALASGEPNRVFSFSGPVDPPRGFVAWLCARSVEVFFGKRPDEPSPTLSAELERNGITLVRTLGQGGMGTAWLAQAKGRNGKPIHLIVKEPLDNGRDSLPKNAAALSREHEFLEELYPGKVRLLRGRNDEKVALVMEVYPRDAATPDKPAPTLDDILYRAQRSSAFNSEAGRDPRFLDQLADSVLVDLKRNHDLKVIHRDLKPNNILVQFTEHGPKARIIDYGLAQWGIGEQRHKPDPAGNIFGTPGYLSVGAWHGRQGDYARDVYALQKVLEQMYLRDYYETPEPHGNPITREHFGLRWWELGVTPERLDGISAPMAWALRSRAVASVEELQELIKDARSAPGMKGFLERYKPRWETAFKNATPETKRELALEVINATMYGPEFVKLLAPEMKEAVVKEARKLREWQLRNPNEKPPYGYHPSIPAALFLLRFDDNR